MERATVILDKLRKQLSKKLQTLDHSLLLEFEPTIGEIEHLRYEFFTECIKKHSNDHCFDLSLRYDIQVDFPAAATSLQQCLSRAARRESWEAEGEACLEAYGVGLRTELQKQVNRIFKADRAE